MAKGEGFKGKNRKKKSSVRRNTKAYKRVDPYWAENPDKLKGKLNAAHKKQNQLQEKRREMNPGTTNEKLRKKAIKGLVKKNAGEVNKKVYQEEEHFRENKIKYVKLPGESPTQFKQRIQDDCDVAMCKLFKMDAHTKMCLGTNMNFRIQTAVFFVKPLFVGHSI